jgi:hypothetical protein
MTEQEMPAHVSEALEKIKETRQKIAEETEKRMSGKPTPTQEELDKANLGFASTQHEDDGSGPDPAVKKEEGKKTKQSEAKPSSAPYSTRTSHPAGHQS